MDGRVLTFHLAGINNQNFLMRDEETGSFWQQISGKAVSGPMKGKQLEPVHSDELSFALWRQENPRGTVLLPVASFEKEYEPKDWEARLGRARSVVDTSNTGIAPRAIMLGIEVNGQSRAYPLDRVLQQKLVQDRLGGKPILLMVGPDSKSIRAFLREGDIDFYAKGGGVALDSQQGKEWNFQGCAGADQCLKPVSLIKDYWFDWHLYHPDTTVYEHK